MRKQAKSAATLAKFMRKQAKSAAILAKFVKKLAKIETNEVNFSSSIQNLKIVSMFLMQKQGLFYHSEFQADLHQNSTPHPGTGPLPYKKNLGIVVGNR